MAGKQAMTLKVNLEKWLAKSQEAARLKFIDVCLEAREMIVERTPVDTGFCRSMWAASINQAPNVAKVAQPKGYSPVGGAAAAAASFASIDPVVMGATLGDRVWIYNPTEYAPALENGHSKQAPNGMVAVTLTHLQAKYG